VDRYERQPGAGQIPHRGKGLTVPEGCQAHSPCSCPHVSTVDRYRTHRGSTTRSGYTDPGGWPPSNALCTTSWRAARTASEPAGGTAAPLQGTCGSDGLNLGGVTFEWDARKAAANFKKHGVTFEDGRQCSLTRLRLRTATPTTRWTNAGRLPWVIQSGLYNLGYTMKKELVFVSHCERGERIRIIGARPATRTERRQYEEGIGS